MNYRSVLVVFTTHQRPTIYFNLPALSFTLKRDLFPIRVQVKVNYNLKYSSPTTTVVRGYLKCFLNHMMSVRVEGSINSCQIRSVYFWRVVFILRHGASLRSDFRNE